MKESDSEELPDFFMPGEEAPINETSGDSVYEQLSLFPSAEEQVGNIAINHANDMFPFSVDKPITDEMVDYVLLTGGGQRDSRPRIFAKYQKWLDSAKMAEFLKREYGRGGKGFTFEGEPLSVWYDEDGMKFARADAARFQPMRTLSWMEVEEHTYNLILDGKYMDEAEMWHVPTLEKMELASKVYNFFQDEYGSVPKELEIPHIHPDAEEKLAEYFSSQEGIDRVLSHMDQAIGALQRGDVKARFHLIYRPEDIRESVEELKRRPMKFPPAENLEVPVETFITQDEIDYRLSRGSGFEHGLFRIYEFFQSNHDKKEFVMYIQLLRVIRIMGRLCTSTFWVYMIFWNG